MASEIDIGNYALSKLGESRIISFDDDTKGAREVKANYEIVRDAELRAHRWNFAKKRITLPALTEVPAFGWERKFQLPVDLLQVIQAGEFDPAINFSDYRHTSSKDWEIEAGNVLLSNSEAPLPLIYVSRIEDTATYDPLFIQVLACALAMQICQSLTQSSTKKDDIREDYKLAISLAVRANVIELPPTSIQDDTWILGRQ